MAKAKIVCPNCGKHYAFDEANAGRTYECRKCGRVFELRADRRPAEAAPRPDPPSDLISEGMVRSVAALVAADGVVDPAERAFLDSLGRRLGLDPRAIDLILEEAEMGRRAVHIPANQAERRRLFDYLVKAAVADGEVVPRELAALKAVGRRMGIFDREIGEAIGRADKDREGAPSPGAAAPESHTSRVDGIPDVWRVGDVILDLYEVERVHEGGGMGLVYKVHHRDWGVDLAVKSPRPACFETQGQKEDFVRECLAWIGLGVYPHVTTCFYVRTLGGIPRVFAEYVEGGSLQNWIESGELYEGGHDAAVARILDIAIQFAWGLRFAHGKGLIHQDVKPANVLMMPDGTAKVSDFGLADARAAACGEETDIDNRTMFASCGGYTPAYCSPEQANRQVLTRRTDIWSWAVSVLEMFTGGIVWRAGQIAHKALAKHVKGGYDRAPVGEMPAGLPRLLERCLRQKPNKRPHDFDEIVAGLRDVYRSATGAGYAREEHKPAEAVAGTLNNEGVSLIDLGLAGEAEKRFDAALRADVHHPEATLNRGLLQWRSGRCTDAELIQRLEEVRKTHADTSRDEYVLALAHIERGDAESVVKLLGRMEREERTKAEVKRALKLASLSRKLWSQHLRTLKGHEDIVTSIALSRDGGLALAGGADRSLRVWDATTGVLVGTFQGHTGSVAAVSLGTEAHTALSGSHDRTLRLWDVPGETCVRTFEGHTGSVNAVALAADGRAAVSGADDNTVRVWDVKKGTCLRTCEGHAGAVTSVAVSDDGRLAVSGSMDTTLRVWEVATGRQLKTLPDHVSAVRALALSGDGHVALSGGEDGTLRLWNVETGECVKILAGHTAGVAAVALSADGKLALSGGSGGTFRLWDTSAGRSVRTFEGHTAGVTSVALSADGRYALSGSRDKTVRLSDLGVVTGPSQVDWVLTRIRSTEEAIRNDKRFAEAIDAAKKAADSGDVKRALEFVGKARRVPGRARALPALDLQVKLGAHCRRKSLKGGWFLRRLEGHDGAVHSVSLNADCRYAVSGGDDGMVLLWDLGADHRVRRFKGHDGAVTAVALTPDGRRAFSTGVDGKMRVWDTASGKCLATASEARAGALASVASSPDGRQSLMGGGWGEDVRLWDVATGKTLIKLEGHAGRVKAVALGADGRLALSGGTDTHLRLWDVHAGTCLRVIKGHGDEINSVALSADGRLALSASADKTLRSWNIGTGMCVRIFGVPAATELSVALSADGRFALAGSVDRTLRLWDAVTGQCLWTFEGHTGDVTSVALGADCRYALSGSDDGSLRLWEFEWEYEFPGWATWDAGARPHLVNFLTLHTPRVAGSSLRRGQPAWTEDDFRDLLRALGNAGYGWLRPEGVMRELRRLSAGWDRPPLLRPRVGDEKPKPGHRVAPSSERRAPPRRKPSKRGRAPAASSGDRIRQMLLDQLVQGINLPPPARPAAQSVGAFQLGLTVMAGPHRGGKFAIDEGGEYIIGRSPECDLALPRDPRVSRLHAILEARPFEITVRALGASPVVVNGVRYDGPAVELGDGDEVQLGQTVLRLRMRSAAMHEAARPSLEALFAEHVRRCAKASGRTVPSPATCLIVKQVASRSIAARAGIREGDLLVTVDGGPASSFPTDLYDLGTPERRYVFFGSASGETVELDASGIEIGVDLGQTPEGIRATFKPRNASNMALQALWEARAWQTLDVLTSASLKANPRQRSTPVLVFRGAALFETGRRDEGIRLVKEYADNQAQGWTKNFAAVGYYYLGLDALRRGDRKAALSHLVRAYDHDEQEQIASAIKKAGGEPPRKRKPQWVGNRFPSNYALPALVPAGGPPVSFSGTLQAMPAHKLLLVCLLSGYRSNGPYLNFMRRYRHYATYFATCLHGLHVITSNARPVARRDGSFSSEDSVRAAGLPVEILFDGSEAVGSAVMPHSSPNILAVDRNAKVVSQGDLDPPDWWDTLAAAQLI